ncbi:MAG: FecR family protein [Planctomycetota bacterium]|nr:FecR family protein [Planctomycetota bacterium]
MSCAQARRQIERLIEEGDLKDAERALLMAHVRGCPPCKAELDNCRRLEGRLRGAFAALDTAPGFNARVLAALPGPEGKEAPEWLKNLLGAKRPHPLDASLPAPETSTPLRRSWLFLRRAGLSAGIAAILTLGLWCAYWAYTRKAADVAPTVAEVKGKGVRVNETGSTVPLAAGDALLRNESIVATAETVDLVLASKDQRIGRLALAPHSKLRVVNRHSYQLLSGAAYFEVRKDRPKAAADGRFEVDAGGLATVSVTGTAFVIDLAARGPGGLVVLVQEGSVQVQSPAITRTSVAAGQELTLTTGGVSIRSTGKTHPAGWLAALNLPGEKPDGPRGVKPPADARPPARVGPPPPVRRSLRWDERVKDVVLLDKSLGEGIDALAEALDKPQELLALRQQLQGPLISDTAALSFSIHNEMPLQAALRWMARDVLARFEPGAEGRAARFVTSTADELPGAPASGNPEDVRPALETRVPENIVGINSLAGLTEFLGARCGVTIIVERAQSAQFTAAARDTGFTLPGATVLQKLDALLAALHAGVAWNDDALNIAHPARIEALTQAARRIPVGPQLVGQPANPLWANDLKQILEEQAYPASRVAVPMPWLPGVRLHSDAALAGRPPFAGLTWEPAQPEGGLFCCRTGLLGEALMRNLLAALQSESPPVPGAAGLLSQAAALGPVPDMEALIEQARPRLRVALAPGVQPQPFSKHAYVNKSLPLGEALEWGAWLAGCGLRPVNNDFWTVDDAAVCYGPPALQVLSLQPVIEQRKELAAELPRLFARVLPDLYPTFFANTKFRCVGSRIVFTGDRRQLQLAQRLRASWEAGGPSTLAEARTWKPKSRVDVEKNLAEPFSREPLKLSGSFAGLLRHGALSSQLRCTVLVDPAAMREKSGTEIKDLDTANLSRRQVLERLASAAGLVMVIEGDVVWLRLAR